MDQFFFGLLNNAVDANNLSCTVNITNNTMARLTNLRVKSRCFEVDNIPGVIEPNQELAVSCHKGNKFIFYYPLAGAIVFELENCIVAIFIRHHRIDGNSGVEVGVANRTNFDQMTPAQCAARNRNWNLNRDQFTRFEWKDWDIVMVSENMQNANGEFVEYVINNKRLRIRMNTNQRSTIDVEVSNLP